MKVLPANGVYTVRVQLPGDEQASRPGVAYVGRRHDSREEHPTLIEVHLVDVQADLYGQRLVVEFIARLPEDRLFNSIQALQAQMKVDADQTQDGTPPLDGG